jgi:hypothetical protein
LVIGSAASRPPTDFAAASGMASTMGKLAIDSGPDAEDRLLIVSTRFTQAIESGIQTAGSELWAGVGSGHGGDVDALAGDTVRRGAIVRKDRLDGGVDTLPVDLGIGRHPVGGDVGQDRGDLRVTAIRGATPPRTPMRWPGRSAAPAR